MRDWRSSGCFRLYVFPIGKIAEETGIMHGVNPGHRIHVEGSRDIKQLAAAINSSADAFETLNRSVEERIAEARARIEEEKNILSVALAELPEGVLVCSPEGRIILYNERARQLLESSVETPAGMERGQTDGFVGLGRSIFNAIDKPLITGALDEIAAHLRRGGHELASSFVIAGRSGRLLQVATVHILGPLREMTAFALILTDATEQMEAFRRSESLLQSYIIQVRRALASIRSSVELILDVPGLPPAKSHEFHRIIHREALAAGDATDRVMVEYAASTRPPGPLARMRAQDFLVSFLNTSVIIWMGAVRGLFAMSFDRQLPVSLAAVGKSGVPTNATHVVGAISLIGCLIGLGDAVGTESAGVMLAILDFTGMFFIWCVGLAGLFLPYTRPDLFEKSTFQQRWFGVPAMSIVGGIVLLIGFYMILYVGLELATTYSQIGMAALVTLGFAVVAYMYGRNRREGIDPNQIFAQVPPPEVRKVKQGRRSERSAALLHEERCHAGTSFDDDRPG